MTPSAPALAPTVPSVKRPSAVNWGKTTSLFSSPWLLPTVSAISGLAGLPDNWDGYGSPKVSQTALVRTIQLAASISCEELPIPTVCPVSGGGVGISWELGDRELEFTVYPNGCIRYLRVLGSLEVGPENVQDGTLVEVAASDVGPLVGWLLSV